MKKLIAMFLLCLVALATPMMASAECFDCGKIKSIEAFTGNRSGTGGAVAGAVVGGLLGNQVGGGTGKTVATVAGVAGGAMPARRSRRIPRRPNTASSCAWKMVAWKPSSRAASRT
jgi:hypothetical protein